VNWCEQTFGIRVQIVAPAPGQSGFAVLPRRWVVERTLAWLGKCQRLSKAYEHLATTSAQWIYAALLHLMLKRLFRN
jgi:putative transposase